MCCLLHQPSRDRDRVASSLVDAGPPGQDTDNFTNILDFIRLTKSALSWSKGAEKTNIANSTIGVWEAQLPTLVH